MKFKGLDKPLPVKSIAAPQPKAAADQVQLLQLKVKVLQALLRTRTALWQAVTVLLQALGGPMAVPTTVTEALDLLDKATNDVAAEISDLTSQISTGMTQADVDSVVTRLNAASEKLEGLASNPANPVPGTTGSTDGGGTPPTP